jgi:hypothetical protein
VECLSPLELVRTFDSITRRSIDSLCVPQVGMRTHWTTLTQYGSLSSNARMPSMYGSALQTRCCSTLSSHGNLSLSPPPLYLLILFAPAGIHVMGSRAQSPTSHYASPKAFKNSNSNSNLHQHERQSRVRSPLAPRTSSKPLKASRAGSYSDRRLPSRLAVPALARAR